MRTEKDFHLAILRAAAARDFDGILQIIQESAKFKDVVNADGIFPVTLLEEATEGIPVADEELASQVIDLLEAAIPFCTPTDLTYYERSKMIAEKRGPYIVWLRMCNELMRRMIPGTSMGRLHILMASRLFPMSDRSGTNVKSESNYERLLTISEASQNEKSLEYMLYHADELDVEPVAKFDEFKTVISKLPFMRSPGNGILNENQKPWPKEQKILALQIFIVINHLLIQTRRKPTSKEMASGTTSTMTEREAWIHSTMRRLSRVSGAEQICAVLREEEPLWTNWKLVESCAPFERGPIVLPRPVQIPPEDVKMDIDEDSDKLDKQNPRELKAPDVELFWHALRLQLDPKAGIDREYRLSRNEAYLWQAKRFLSQFDPEGFARVHTPEDLEEYVKTRPPLKLDTSISVDMM